MEINFNEYIKQLKVKYLIDNPKFETDFSIFCETNNIS